MGYIGHRGLDGNTILSLVKPPQLPKGLFKRKVLLGLLLLMTHFTFVSLGMHSRQNFMIVCGKKYHICGISKGIQYHGRMPALGVI